MKRSLCRWAVALAFGTAGLALAQDRPPELPTWKDLMARGVVPYRQLTVDDVPIDDTAHPKLAFHIQTAIEPKYHFTIKPYTGFAYAYVDQWMVFSGLNKNGTSRKKAFKTMKAELPFAQALLDINEINARKIAALKPGELPNARGNTFEEAQTELTRKLKEFLEVKYQENQREMEAFGKATENGANRKKVRELTAEIRRRLEATPATTVPPPDAGATPVATSPATASPSLTPAPSAIATPSPSPRRG